METKQIEETNKPTVAMQEAFKEISKKEMTDFIKLASDSVTEGNEAIMKKGISIRYTADYCNGVVAALMKMPEFKGMVNTQIKCALPFIFKAGTLNTNAKYLHIVED